MGPHLGSPLEGLSGSRGPARSRRQLLLDAIADVVSECGYQGASVSRVVAAAGVSRNVFYEHFANKEECFLAAYDESVEEAMRLIRAAAAGDGDPWERRLEAGVAAFLAHAAARPARAWLCIVEALAAGPRALARRDAALRAFAAALDRCRDGAAAQAPSLMTEVAAGGIYEILYARMRVQHGRLDAAVPANEQGGTIRVELNHTDPTVLPSGFRLGDNDTRILAVAAHLKAEGHSVTLVSKDLPMRVKASALGIEAQEYRAELAVDSGWTGMREIHLAEEQMARLWEEESLAAPDAAMCGEDLATLPVHTGLVIHSPRGSALGRRSDDGSITLVRGDQEVFGVHGRSAEQRIAIDLLLDTSVGIVSMGGRAGTGKSALALCAGLEAVMERRQHKKVMVFRPLYAVGGQDLGYLPGSESEKMNPWAQAVFDTLGAMVSSEVVEEVLDRGMLEVLPLTHIRGRSLHDAFVIVDEAQSLERNVLLTMLSRIGQDSRVVLTHDVAQRDNLRVGRHDGIAAVIEALKGHPLFAHVTLERSERSAVAALVTDMLERLDL